MGPLIVLFVLLVTSALGFKARVDPLLNCFFPACIFFRFTSGATPADLLIISMAAEPFQFTYLQITYPQVLMGV